MGRRGQHDPNAGLVAMGDRDGGAGGVKFEMCNVSGSKSDFRGLKGLMGHSTA